MNIANRILDVVIVISVLLLLIVLVLKINAKPEETPKEEPVIEAPADDQTEPPLLTDLQFKDGEWVPSYNNE